MICRISANDQACWLQKRKKAAMPAAIKIPLHKQGDQVL
jgi:hypothetical protein